MRSDSDHYEAYYADKLWSMLPSVYRMEDAVSLGGRGPLRELCERIGVQAAILRRSIDRLWEDQSIETCDEWVVAYIGELLGTQIIPGLPPRGQRLDVAKSIHYRRRKGTVGVLEELAHDITGWDARVVEMFRRVARTHHSLDPAFGPLAVEQGLIGRRTGTPMGGLANLRDRYGASRANYTSFDELFHTADVRRGKGRVGWHNLSRLGIFLWRLQSVLIEGVDPVPCTSGDGYMTFDPTGREIPLFAKSVRSYGNDWIAPDEFSVPGPITSTLLSFAWDALYASSDATKPDVVLTRSLGVFEDEAILTRDKVEIDPERGRFHAESGDGRVTVSYCYGFSSTIGAGAYDRRVEGAVPDATDSNTVIKTRESVVLPAAGTVEIDASYTYEDVSNAKVDTGELLVLKAGVRRRPLLRFSPVDSATPAAWAIEGQEDSEGKRSSLWLDGLFVSGGVLVLSGYFEQVVISACTFDPGSYGVDGQPKLSADQRYLVAGGVQIEGQVDNLLIDRCIMGPVEVGEHASVDTLMIRDSLLQAFGDRQVLNVPTGVTSLLRSSVLGKGLVRRLEARSSILHDIFDVADHQHGSLRFSAWREGSMLPRKYASVQIAPKQVLFSSLSYGQPSYGQLLDATPQAILSGAEDGSEMGAFSREKNAIKEQGLLRKLREYMPVGLVPVLIHVT